MIKADCWKCAEAESKRLEEAGDWVGSLGFMMYLCPECGNKRCPKATDHDLPCGHSNEPGQPGSAYQKIDPNQTPEQRQANLDEWLAELKNDLKRL